MFCLKLLSAGQSLVFWKFGQKNHKCTKDGVWENEWSRLVLAVKMCLMVSKWWNGGEKQWPGFVFFEVFGTGFVKCKDVIFEWMRVKVFWLIMLAAIDLGWCLNGGKAMARFWFIGGLDRKFCYLVLCKILFSLEFDRFSRKVAKVIFNQWSSIGFLCCPMWLVSALSLCPWQKMMVKVCC